jgi:hypothetical protein
MVASVSQAPWKKSAIRRDHGRILWPNTTFEHDPAHARLGSGAHTPAEVAMVKPAESAEYFAPTPIRSTTLQQVGVTQGDLRA